MGKRYFMYLEGRVGTTLLPEHLRTRARWRTASRLWVVALGIVGFFGASAQSVEFAEDGMQRGWYDRPWQRYEAEPGMCETDGEFLLPPVPYTQEPLQSEATRQTALSLNHKGEYVSWKIDRPGRGVTIRFSLPDSSVGTGRQGTLRLSVNDGRPDTDIELNSYWAWQYTTIVNTTEKYPDNTPSADKFARMRFDEVVCLLDEDIPAGAILTLSKLNDDDIAYTIDFLELEPVAPALTFEEVEAADKVLYDGSGLGSFIAANGGRTIFIPAGVHNESRPVVINTPGTRIIGAGLWYTTVNFTASSDNRSTYSARGFHCSQGNVELSGMSILTVNNKRYFQNNPSFQVGKGLNGSWGENSRLSDLRIEHFECGGWISGARGLTMERCRLRNNYADGINLANNSSNCRVSHCSFRNNGDDDMASWSTGSYASDNEFSYNTAECNWRASSLGFFGGRRQRAHHLAIYDAMEAGARVTCDFQGTGFSSEGEISLSDITIRRCGAKRGTPGTNGGFWGGSDASLELRAGYAYNLKNISVARVDIYDSRYDGVSIESQSGKRVENLELHNIYVEGVGEYAYAVNIAASVRGNGHYSGISAKGVQEPIMATVPAGFDFAEQSSGIKTVTDGEWVYKGEIVSGEEAAQGGCTLCLYDLQGHKIENIGNPGPGVYIMRNKGKFVKILIK